MTAPSTNLQGISSKMSVGSLPASIAYKKQPEEVKTLTQ